MTCPLCGTRRARRSCPALGQQICPVCCGTKRLVEIQCPSDCVYLASAREHPAAAQLRQRQHDVGALVHLLRDFNNRQADLFTGIAAFLRGYEPLDLQPLIDDDVAEAVASLADTFETASRGLIYEHRPQSLPADRLAAALKPVIAEAAGNGGSAFERDAAMVLKRLQEAIGAQRTADPSNRRAFLDLLVRVLRKRDDHQDEAPEASDAPRLIVP